MNFIHVFIAMTIAILLLASCAVSIYNLTDSDIPKRTALKRVLPVWAATITSWIWAPWLALGCYTLWQVNMNKVIDTGRPYIVEPNAPVRVTEGTHEPVVRDKIETPSKGATIPCNGK